jgi:hypothetical protein
MCIPMIGMHASFTLTARTLANTRTLKRQSSGRDGGENAGIAGKWGQMRKQRFHMEIGPAMLESVSNALGKGPFRGSVWDVRLVAGHRMGI